MSRPLRISAEMGHAEILQLLLEAHARVDAFARLGFQVEDCLNFVSGIVSTPVENTNSTT